ncbi:amino acid adenylation domain-containing protein [Photorhabdus noenieputensis]|uniref:non-ribosomal peptide synthetase/type I polyketide synthase n=1 Tax=Photorhabdus noenieputensis TaxID=1208607 RepID=UPI001BD3A366|nr:non-ribosomal peptide synthetase/type I polyketide synthase [Photorhabdus noenieputensis]MBS9437043.1 amino acid adenylation domain-containing protein [Photorhabdus noenieputensis]MCK3670394.1 amino acid adenylation domain-containing protein [Photorhabdus noenieputensis]
MTDLTLHYDNCDPIAVIGLACRFPRSPDSDAFWHNLQHGVECTVPLSRQTLLDAGIPPEVIESENFVNRAAILEKAEQFDASLFGYSRQEAEILDPQQRLFLQTAWHALEHAGYAPRHVPLKTGVFGSSRISTWPSWSQFSMTDVGKVKGLQALISNDKDYLATRTAYKLNLKGPALTVQTACSSSLVAVHMACENLRAGECDMALAGGVAVSFPQESGYLYQPGMIFSPDGHCRSFDSQANGTYGGNGVGVVTLKRLNDALRDGDPIMAVLRGSAINNDGNEKVGFTAPSVNGQRNVIIEALQLADVSIDDVGMIEAHGTGTPLGDPIEVDALRSIFSDRSVAVPPCYLGSVKSNMGHLDTAAGIASLIKAVLSVWHGYIPPTINVQQPNPALRLEQSPFRLATQGRRWTQALRTAGVSSFGIGGTNCHVVVQSLPEELRCHRTHHAQTAPLLLSAASESSLRRLAQRYATALNNAPEHHADLAWTALQGRDLSLPWRLALTLTSQSAEHLSAFANKNPTQNIFSGQVNSESKQLWQFSGQGCQWSGMGKAMYVSSPVFSAMLDRCCAACASELALPLKAVMFGEHDAALATTEYAQPAIVAHQIALAAHWRALGLKPDYVLGHSVGEFSAAVVAGIFTPEQVMPLVAVRGKLMQSCSRGGAMLAVFANEEDVFPFVHSLALDLAACNGPQHWVWAGTETEITALAQRLEQQQIRCQRLNVACAAHSAMLDGVLEAFSLRCSQLQPALGEIPLISTLRANIATAEQLASPDYWRNHMRQTVRYYPAVEFARQQGVALFMEMGADAQLTGIGRRVSLPQETWIAGVQRQSSPEAAQQTALMQLYCAGVHLDWPHLFPFIGEKCHAPLYPFDEQHYRFPATKSVQPTTNINAGLDVNALLDPAIEQNPDAATLRVLYTDALVYQCHGCDAEQGFGAIDTIRAGRLQPCWRPFLEQLLTYCVQQGYYREISGPTAGKIYRPDRPLPYAKRRLLESRLLTAFPALIYAGERLFALLSDRCDLPRQIVATPATTNSWLPAPQPCPDTHYALHWRTINIIDNPRSSTAYTLRSSTANDEMVNHWRRAGIVLQPESENILLLLTGSDVLELCDQVITELKRDEATSLTVVTCCAQPETTLSPENINPAQYAVWALLRVAVEEYPYRRIQAIDIAAINDADALSLALGYLSERNRWLRVRGNQVSVPVLQRQSLLPSQQSMSIPHQGWHIVTGGMGGIGQISIRWLLAQGARKIAVFARRQHADWDAFVQALSLNAECEIRWIKVDVTDTPALLNAVQTLAQEDGIAGAIHAAGIADHTRLAEIEPRRLSQVLSVKALSASVLQAALKQHNAHYLLLHASAASILGAQGQSAYAVANAYLESLALTAPNPLMVKTLVWGVWGGVGMARDQRLVEKLAQDGMLPFSVNEGIWHFNQSLRTASPCYLAMRLDEHHPDISRRLQADIDHSHPVATPAPSHSVDNTLYQDSEERLNWLRQRVAALLRLEQPERLESQQDLLQFGLDSLLFLELNAVIHQQFGVRLTAELAYQNITLAGLNRLIGEALPEQPVTCSQPEIIIDRAQRYAPFPLTPIQHAYWIGRTQAIDFGGVACHVLFEWDLTLGSFDIDRFEKAWNALIQRHGMLRMVVDEDGQQRILPETPWYALSQDDLRMLDETACQQALVQRRHTLSYQVPPAEQWPLFEVSVSLLPNARCRLHMNLDLLQFDVQSFRIMMDDLQRAYHQQPLMPQVFTFRDYVMAEQAQRASKEWRASWAYWQEQLPSLPPAPRLPLNPQLPQRSQPQFTTYEGRLAQSDWQMLKQCWQQWGVTPSAGLLTLFAHTLEWYSRHPLFTLNLTFFNRQPFHPEVQDLIGDFTSVMLMDFDLRKTTSLRASMEKTQALLWQRLSHNYVNGVEVLRELGRQQNGEAHSRQPLTPVVFTSMLGMEREGVAIKQSITQLLGDPVFVLSQTPQVWLDHQVMEVDGDLLFNWYCMDDVLVPGVIEALFTAYNALLIQICRQPERIEHYDLHTPPFGHARYDFLHIQQQEQLPIIVTTKEHMAQSSTTETADEQLHEIEQQVIALWCSLLSQPIQRHSDFFQSGGDSLIATRMVVQLRRQGYEQANLQQLFEYPKLSEFCRTLRTIETVETTSATQAVPFETQPASEQTLPLTALQYAYWLGESQLFQFGNGIAHFYAELAINDLDLPRFTTAWNRVVDHHEQLRGYVKDGRYHILPKVPCYTPTVIDCRDMMPTQRETKLADARDILRTKGVPSDNWPLFNLTLYHTDDRAYLLHLTIDLLVIDGKSLTLILRDLQRGYQEPNWQPEPPVATISDYIQSQEDEKTGEAWQQSREYWLNRLPYLPDAPVLPLKDYQSHELNQQCLTGCISPQQWQRLQQRAAEYRASPSQVMLTLFTHILAVWGNSEHFTINILHSNRLLMPQHCDTLVGNLSTTSLLEVDLRNSTGFSDAVSRIQKQWLADLQHALFDGQLVLREKNQHCHNLNAGMPIVFNDTTGTVGQEPSGLGTLNLFGAQTPHVYLDCILISNSDGGVTIQWVILPQLFQPQVVENMFAHYQASVAALLEPDYQWSAPLPEWLPANDRILCQNSNATKEFFPPHTLCSLIEQAVNRYPKRTAVVDAYRQIDYHTLWSQSLTLAVHLQEQENQHSSLIGVVMEKGWEQIVAVIAVLLAGRAYLPIDASYPRQRIHQLLASGQVDTVLTQPKFAQQMSWPDDIQVISLDELLLNRSPKNTAEQRLSVCPEDLAYVIFTSGSTGKPKGVMIDHQGAVNTILDINQRITLNELDTVLAISELTFDLSVYDLFGTLSCGAKLVIPSPGDSRQPDKLLAWLQQESVTVWNSVPAFVQLLEEYAKDYPHSLNSLRWVLMSGDWIPTNLPERLFAIHPALNLLSLGGATEASIWSIAYPIVQVDPNWRSIPYGKPLANQTFYVLNATLSPCPVWVTGELYIGGQGLALGYWADLEKTAQAFITHPQTGERLYRTGDLGRWRPDGNIEFLGRNDHQIKVRGYRIELGEIEHRLCEHPDIQQALAFACTTSTGALQLVAGVRLSDEAPLSTELLPVFPHWLQQTLPAWMCPQRFIILDAIPVSDNGKIDRSALVALVEETTQDINPTSVALSVTEQAVLDLWQSVLAQQAINVHESFFTLGGDSLAAVRLMVKINQTFNRRYPLSLLQAYDTVHALAEFIEHQPENPCQGVILNKGSIEQPTLFIVHPIGGHLLGYRHLAANFGDQRMIGLAFSPDNLNTDTPSVAALAADYISQIRAFQPQGPYALAGWSFGGLVAYEMTHQLRAMGERVSQCILIDSFAPNVRTDLTLNETFCHRHFLLDLQGQFPGLTLDNHVIAADTKTFLNAMHDALPQSAQIDSSLTTLYDVWRHNLNALLDYRPPRTSQPFWLIRAAQALPDFMDYLDPTTIASIDLGWQAFGPVHVTQLAGDHYTLFQHEHVGSLITCIKDILNSVSTTNLVKENI